MWIEYVMDFLNKSLDELFDFVPGILRIFAVMLIFLFIGRFLDMKGTKTAKTIKWIINGIFFLYCFFRLVPFDNLNINLEVSGFSDVLILILTLLPYISLVILGNIIKKKKIVKFFINYHVIHILFLSICWIYNYFDTNAVNLTYTFWYTVAVYTGSIFAGLDSKKGD